MDILARAQFYRKIKPEVWKVVKRLQRLRSFGKDDKEIEIIFKALNLPLGMHLFILGHYSELMEAKIN